MTVELRERCQNFPALFVRTFCAYMYIILWIGHASNGRQHFDSSTCLHVSTPLASSRARHTSLAPSGRYPYSLQSSVFSYHESTSCPHTALQFICSRLGLLSVAPLLNNTAHRSVARKIPSCFDGSNPQLVRQPAGHPGGP
jgi:hypothetical protein